MSNDSNDTAVNNVRDLEALTTVIGALKNLDAAAQRRILESVSSFLGFGRPATSPVHPESMPTLPKGDRPHAKFSDDRTQSPKDFLGEKRPANDVHRVVCLGYYLAHFRDTPHFKTIDISQLNTEAAQPKFSNAAKAVDNAAQRGYLVPAVRGTKQMSALGERLVQALPDTAAAKEVLLSARTRKRARKPVARKLGGTGSPEA